MAHAISFLENYPVAFLSETAQKTWHGLETRIENPVSHLLSNVKVSKEAVTTISGLSVKQVAQVMEVNFDGKNDKFVTGIVGGNYTTQDISQIERRVYQLGEIGVAQEFAAMLNEFGELLLTFKVGSFSIFGTDKHDAFLSMLIRYNYKGHDQFAASIIRAICQNTQRWSWVDAQERGSAFSLRHSRNINERAEEATSKLMGMDTALGTAYRSVQQEMADAESMFTSWAATRATPKVQNDFIKAMAGSGDTTREKNAQDKLGDAIGQADTFYDLFNGLTLANKSSNVRLRDSKNAPQGAQIAQQFGADLFDAGQDNRVNAQNWLQMSLQNA